MNNPPAPTSQPHPASSYPAGPPRPMGPPGTFRPPHQNGFRGPVAGPPGGPPGAGPVMGAGPVKPAMQRPMVNGGGMHPSASMPNFRTGAPPGPPGPPGPPRGPSPQLVPGAGGIRPSYSNSNLQSVNGQGQHQVKSFSYIIFSLHCIVLLLYIVLDWISVQKSYSFG